MKSVHELQIRQIVHN